MNIGDFTIDEVAARLVDALLAARRPEAGAVAYVQAAAVVEVYATAWLNLMTVGGLRDAEPSSILVHAGGSGVGTATVQLGAAAVGGCCGIGPEHMKEIVLAVKPQILVGTTGQPGSFDQCVIAEMAEGTITDLYVRKR